jgi:hypothetical protein
MNELIKLTGWPAAHDPRHRMATAHDPRHRERGADGEARESEVRPDPGRVVQGR